MSNDLIMFPAPCSVEEAVSKAPVHANALAWGVQSLVPDTVKSMILLATSKSEHFRYALAVTPSMAQYLYDQPTGAITNPSLFLRAEQVGSRIGHFLDLEMHAIQEVTPEDEQGMMLLVLDDDHNAVGYLYTQLREYSDHVTVNNILKQKS